MSDEVLEQLVKGYMATTQPTYASIWHGGEPTLMGLDFFRKAVALQEHYGGKGAVVSNSLQSNATRIDDELARHFAHYRFLLGCSLDGPARIHDRCRCTAGGNATHETVMSGIDTLKRHGVEFNILVLVSKANVGQATEIYQYLTGQGFIFQQYIPCVEFDTNGNLLSFAITGREWGEFLCTLFDNWYPHDIHRVSIRLFDCVLQKIVDGTVNACHMGRNCCQYFVVEYNGDIYPCDFFVEASLKIGNIMDTGWDKALASKTYQDFGVQKSHWNLQCESCDCLNYCRGDCLKHRLYAGNTAQNLSWLCAGWRRFFRYTRRRFHEIAEGIHRQRQDATQHSQQGSSNPSTPGRNTPCPCGSGKNTKNAADENDNLAVNRKPGPGLNSVPFMSDFSTQSNEFAIVEIAD